MQAETDAAIARLNAIADPTLAEACEFDRDAIAEVMDTPVMPKQPALDAQVAEVVPFQDWECRPSPGCGPVVEALARGWNRHWHACRSARLRAADAIAQRIDRSLERLYPAPL